MLESFKEAAARKGAGIRETELRLLPGNPDQANELNLFIIKDGSIEELEFPVGTSARVQHSVGAAALVDHRQAAVVRERLLACRSLGVRQLLTLLLGCGESPDAIE